MSGLTSTWLDNDRRFQPKRETNRVEVKELVRRQPRRLKLEKFRRLVVCRCFWVVVFVAVREFVKCPPQNNNPSPDGKNPKPTFELWRKHLLIPTT